MPTFTGTDGDDLLVGGAGDDSLDGGMGFNTINGGAGNDLIASDFRYAGGDSGPIIIVDVAPGTGEDPIPTGLGFNSIDGGAGQDTVAFFAPAGVSAITVGASSGHALIGLDGTGVTDMVNVETLNIAVGGFGQAVQISDLSTTAVRAVNVDLTSGAGYADTVSVTAGAGALTAALSANGTGVVISNTVGAVTTTTTVAGLEAADQIALMAAPGGGAVTITGAPSSTAHIVAIGSAATDTLTGSAVGETLNGGGGADLLRGNGGADFLNGGDGDDTFIWNAGDGADHVDGGTGTDSEIVNAGAAADTLTLTGSSGHAIIGVNGSTAADTTTVERLTLRPAGGADSVVIGDLSGTSVTSVQVDFTSSNGAGDGVADTLLLNTGEAADQVTISSAGATLLSVAETTGGVTRFISPQGLDAVDQVAVNLGGGNDTATANGVPPQEGLVISGGAGDDRLIWNLGAGGIRLDGGDGTDTGVINGGTLGITVVAGAVGAHTTTTINGVAGPSFDNIEALLINGTAGADTLTGGAGDTLHGLGGNDSITTTTGAMAFGDTGNDSLTAQAGGNTLDGGDGDDLLFSQNTSAVGNVLTGGIGSDTVTSFSALDTLNGGDGNDSLSGTSVNGGNGDDFIAASGQGKHLDGGDGADTMTLQSAIATITAGAGDDQIQWRLRPIANDSGVIDGGTGNNLVNVFHDAQDDDDLGGWTLNLTGNGSAAHLNEHHFEPPGPGVAAPDHADLDLSLSNVARLQITGDEHGDLLTIGDLSGTGLQEVDVNLGGPEGADGVHDHAILLGTSGADNVSVDWSNHTGGDVVVSGLPETVVLQGLDSVDAILIQTGAGDDNVNLTGLNALGPLRHVTVDLGAGTNRVLGGTNPWTYVFHAGSGAHDEVLFWRGTDEGGHNILDLSSLHDHSIQELWANHHITWQGADALITDGMGTTLRIDGIDPNSLRAADIIF